MLHSKWTQMFSMAFSGRLARMQTLLCCLLTVALCSASGVHAEDDFADMDLDALMNVEVSSVTKGKGMKLSDAPGAISVISEEDIARTGHQSIPELLRLVPGLHVGRFSANNWAISARGFNGQYNNKMLVMMDGRSLYTPIFSGVYWNIQDAVMEDLKSVEVIRGPGGTLWGANAVNGVINVTTKEAKDTQGLMISSSAGTEDLSNTSVRYGGQLGDGAHYRVYAKYQLIDDTKILNTNNDNSDEYKRMMSGFRMDWHNDADHLTLQGDAYYHESDHSGGGIELWRGANIIARFDRDLSEDSNVQFQFYYDFNQRKVEANTDLERHALDFDFQHSFVPAQGHNVVWGMNYHWHRDSTFALPPGFVSFNPSNAADNTFSVFGQDTMEVVKDTVFLTLGAKVEHNEYTGVEFQPSARLSYRVAEGHTLWSAVSRAVRTPSRVDTGIDVFFSVQGNPNLKSENVMAYELGYRWAPTKHLSFDLATFFNKYENMIATASNTYHNDLYAESYGVELSATWQVAQNLKLIGNYTFQDVETHGESTGIYEGTTPRNQASVRAYYDLSDKLALNTALYWYDNVASENVSSFFRYDLGLTWQINDNVELSVWGQNLADSQHHEYNDGFGGQTGEIESGIYGKLTLTF
ncbi:MAG TPA: hypothetical protein DER01_22320 [Phycisphaerales bacterium]|nr:hypothetical protein [Phycisphaerales bacterium]|tara:strand:+ start:570 stop:2483 length:1914 start_codon:yes stop_codon:yes gene_type:complete